MEKARIILNGYVLTCDAENRGGRLNIAIRDGRVVDISESASFLTSSYPGATVIDAEGKLIIPGFINTHFHSDSVLHRVRTDGLHFGLWKKEKQFEHASRKLLEPSSYDDLRTLYLASYFSHLKSGTTCVGEFGPPVDEKGFLGVLESISRSNVKAVMTLQNWDEIVQARGLGSRKPRCMVSIGKEEDYTVYSFENLSSAARKDRLPLLAHIAETRGDVEIIRKKFRKSPLAVLSDYAALASSTLLVHANHLSDQEVALVEERGVAVVICARSAAFKQTGYPSLRRFACRNVFLCLGTDWGNNDMIREIRFLDRLPLVVPGIRQFSPLELLRMATINGARALGIASETGSIENGKKADLTFLATKDLRLPILEKHATPDQLAEFLVHHLTSQYVSDVMINGEFCVHDGQIKNISEGDLIGGLQQLQEKYYPSSTREPRASTPSRTSVPKPKVIPFVAEEHTSPHEDEGFEEGFSVVQKTPKVFEMRPHSPSAPPPPPSSTPEKGKSKNPDPSKNVNRVFGEDDL